MTLDEYLNYLQEDDNEEEKEEEEENREEEDQGEGEDEDDEEEVEEKAVILKKFAKLIKDPLGKRKLAKLTGLDKEKLEKIIKIKKRATVGAGIGAAGAGGFLASKRADKKGQSL